MIALLFTAEPKAAEDFLQQVEEWEKEEEEREQLHYKELRKYVNSLSKAELQERLYDALVELEDTRNRYWWSQTIKDLILKFKEPDAYRVYASGSF